MTPSHIPWYWSRLRAMSPEEVARRARDRAVQTAWRRRQIRPGDPPGPTPRVISERACPVSVDPAVAEAVPAPARQRLLHLADQVLNGEWTALGVTRHDLESPDWFLDPSTGRRAPSDTYAFSINHRSVGDIADVKQVWELSRHHHVTVLAAAWFLTGDDRYAEAAGRHLRSWWRENPFLSGVHWTSGIELGIRLISWTWTRRLLNAWPPVADLFERNDEAVRQFHWHQTYLSTFHSMGSSANNHVIAEAAGQLVASCGMPWFAESEHWRREAKQLLERELDHNTFPSGVNRELATAYHGFVAELGAVAAIEADAARDPLSAPTLSLVARMFDSAAALVDVRVRPPRQGDSDDGRTLVLDGDDGRTWSSLLAAGTALVDRQPWWPAAPPDIRSAVLTAVRGSRPALPPRATARPSDFPDAGITLLRTPALTTPEVWCRCDAGPHGFLSIAAHAHADALAVEVRHNGVDVLADPGTYCYHGEPEWRAWFRSTRGHNTLEVDGDSQARAGGPFLWRDRPTTTILAVSVGDRNGVERWSAEHDGYRRLHPPAVHRREVVLDVPALRLQIADSLDTQAPRRCRLAFHLGPAITTHLEGSVAELRWSTCEGDWGATLALPSQLQWTRLRGAIKPIDGWYSPHFGVKEPVDVLVGTGHCGPADSLITVVDFSEAGAVGR